MGVGSGEGSTDHRGVPEAPGRVVTLVSMEQCHRLGIEDENEDGVWRTYGVAYRIPQHSRKEVLEKLDHREKGGYERHQVNVYDYHDDQTIVVKNALIYIANEKNPHWLGPSVCPLLRNQQPP